MVGIYKQIPYLFACRFSDGEDRLNGLSEYRLVFMVSQKTANYGILFLVVCDSTLSWSEPAEAMVAQVKGETTATIASLAKEDVGLTIDEQGFVTANDSKPTVDRLSTANLATGVHYLDLVFPKDQGQSNLMTGENAAENSLFFVEQFKANNGVGVKSLGAADSLIAGNNLLSTASGYYEVVDFLDAEGATGTGNKPGGASFPGTSGDVFNFAVRVTGNILIPTAGDWTFLTNNDDGVRLSIDENTLITDDVLHPAEDRLSTTNLSAGVHSLELVFFENTGVASLELWAAPGTETAYNSNFQLVGDTANGGIATTAPVPFSFSPSTGIFLFFSLFACHRRISR